MIIIDSNHLNSKLDLAKQKKKKEIKLKEKNNFKTN